MPKKTDHWTDTRCAYWKRNEPKWRAALDQYEADPETLSRPDYLIRRLQGEDRQQFTERQKLYDPSLLFGLTVDSIAGRMQAARVNRTFGEALGSPSDPDSEIYPFWRNVDRQGTNYEVLLIDAMVLLTVVHEFWTLVDGPRRGEGGRALAPARWRLIEPAAVVDWIEDEDGQPIEVLVKGERVLRSGIREPAQRVDVYKLYTLGGVVTVTVTAEGEAIEEAMQPYGSMGEDGPFYFFTDERRERRRLPIFRTRLPLRRMVGYTWARKNNILGNQVSLRDNVLRIACTPTLNLVATAEQAEDLLRPKRKGSNALLNDPQAKNLHAYMAPPSGPAEIQTAVVEEKYTAFQTEAFAAYEDAARQAREMTATEVESRQAARSGAFLNLAAAALDEFETSAFALHEQIVFPDDPSTWGQFTCERKRDFRPLNSPQEIRDLQARYLAERHVPASAEQMAEVLRRIYQHDSLSSPDPEALEVAASLALTDRRLEDLVRLASVSTPEQAARALQLPEDFITALTSFAVNGSLRR